MNHFWATVHILQKFRCNICGKTFTAQMPEGASSEKYDATAAAMIGLLKFSTLAQVLEKIKSIIEKNSCPENGITVIIEPGHYSYEPTLQFANATSGTKDNPITFKVKEAKKATFNGGLNLTRQLRRSSKTRPY